MRFFCKRTVDLSTTSASHERGSGDGRSAVRAWGSVATSALTFDDAAAGLSHANSAVAAAASAAAARGGGGEDLAEEALPIGGAQEEAGKAPEKSDAPERNLCSKDGSGDVSCYGGGGAAESNGGEDPETLLLAANAGGTQSLVSATAARPPSQDGDRLELLPPRSLTATPPSGNGRKTSHAMTSAVAAAAAATITTPGSDEASADFAPEISDQINPSASDGGPLRRAPGTATAEEATAAADGFKRTGVPTCELSRPEDNDSQRDTGGGGQGEREGEEERNGGGEGDGGSAAEWWREALGPTSRRPVTRRSLDHGGGGVPGRGAQQGAGRTWGPWEEDPRGGCGQHERSGSGWTSNGIVQGGEACSGGRRRASTAVPICRFSTESKQRNLEDFLKRRCDARLESRERRS